MKARGYLITLALIVASCRPCSQPELCLPTSYMSTECVETCMRDLPEANLANWWRQFDDPLLISLIERGIGCNYDLRIAREKICEARAVFGIDFSRLLPHVDAFLLFNRLRNSQTLAQSDFTGGDFINFYQAGFDSIWEIDLFGKNLDRAKAACFDVAATQAEVRDVHVSVTSEIATNYFLIRTLQERMRITETHIKAEAELLELVKERYEAGLISQLDIYLTKALLKGRESILPQLQIEFYQAIYALAVMIDELPETLVNCFCDERPLPCIEAKFPLGLPTELLCRRGDVRNAEFKMLAAGARVLAARKEFFPTISLDSIFSYATGFFTSWFKSESRDWNLTPSLFLPIFHGGKILSHIAFETSIQKQSVLDYERSVLEAVAEVESALTAYFNEGTRIQALSEEVNAYKEARELALTLYSSGMVDFLYVIDTERDLFITEMVKAESKEELMAYLVGVYKALGGGWECCD